ncbi:hydantoinase B/oxoprolinase family protein [Paraburkholderia sp. GAS32]|uniref:hydantoinase B/oxoprolinase family protein n=1 Tax=Paraburkholderia sp. GAS32 TaxID=3035129 RepID=UPI003D262E8E
MNREAEVDFDGIALEVFRSRLQAVAEEGALTIERTACSPTIAESRDCSCSVLDAAGDLIVGGGAVAHHFGACSHAVRCTLAQHGTSISPGDVFIANDPHNGGGLHYMDVVVQRPVFHDGALIAWVANSGHMIDVGGMTFGSWSPAATECFQEALRLPPVRLFRQGTEVQDTWAIVRNNVRVPSMVEMDIRSLVAGCQVVHDKLSSIAETVGRKRFMANVLSLRDIVSREVRRRISLLENGVYRLATWTEWGDERYRVPCTLTVLDDKLVFDFEGAAPQCKHFFNSKPHVIRSIVTSDVTDVFTHDLPLCAAMFDAIEVRCPPGTVVNASPPAPTASAHFDVALNASMAAHQCLMMAVAISGAQAPGKHLLSGPVAPSCMGLHTWAYSAANGAQDGWLMIEGAMAGGSAGHDRDGYDLFSFMVARKAIIESVDIESFESRYPALVLEKRPRAGAEGAGRYRAGAGCQMSYKPHKTASWTGVMLGMRERLPLPGFAGGLSGANTRFELHRANGQVDTISGHADRLEIRDDEWFEFRLGCGGGFGDPLERDPEAVARDVRQSRINFGEAASVYGVVFDESACLPDHDATRVCRNRLLNDRLARAQPATSPLIGHGPLASPQRGQGRLLYPGVEHHAGIAYAISSGAPLAAAPGTWTDGCPRLEEQREGGVVLCQYLDPIAGTILIADARLEGEPCTIEARPQHWIASVNKPASRAAFK